MSETGGPWDSRLPVGEFAAIQRAGSEPAGQVFGAAVYYLATVAGVSCPGTMAALPVAERLYEARRAALDRMTTECAGRGGHGVVGVSMQVTEVPGTDVTAAAIKFTAAGTAVRASGAAPLARPFTCDLSGPDFVKLITAGWVPAGVQELGAGGVVASAMTLRVRREPCRAHAAAADHFAEAVITGTALARFGRRDSPGRPAVSAVKRLDEMTHPSAAGRHTADEWRGCPR